MISKYGTENDKRNLPAKSRYNKNKVVATRKRSLKEITCTPRKVKKNTTSVNNENYVETHTENNLSNTSSISVNDNNDKGESTVKNRSIFQKTTQSNQIFTRATHYSEETSIEISNEYNSTEKEKSLIILKRNGSSSLELKPCFYCKKLPSNHYC